MKSNLTTEEFDSNQEVLKHVKMVREYINLIIKKLEDRGNNHDASKMDTPEVELFATYTPKLSKSTYGSEEYKKFLEEMKPALDHHYAVNRHHPEHFKDGIKDMNLVDLIEMICDWKAATRKHRDGNILKSLEINSKRFNIDDQLLSILHNTVRLFEE
jgi:hypothetical protein